MPATWFCGCAPIRPGASRSTESTRVPSPPRDDGLMAMPVPAGPVVLTVDWTTTTDVLVGRWLSALSVLALTGLCLLAREPKRRHLS